MPKSLRDGDIIGSFEENLAGYLLAFTSFLLLAGWLKKSLEASVGGSLQSGGMIHLKLFLSFYGDKYKMEHNLLFKFCLRLLKINFSVILF